MQGHQHAHEHAALGETPVLDIGGDVGALLVYLEGPTPSGELQARPLGDSGARFHTGVHHRHVDDGVVYIALYAEVTTGTYEILDESFTPIVAVDVVGGVVTELDLRRVVTRL